MMPAPKPFHSQKTNIGLCLRWVCCAFACILACGCRQRAYTELYVENMASEVRMLEDRIWEYDAAYLEKDAEYESLVQEVARLKKRNSELQRKQSTQQDPDSIRLTPATPLQLKPNTYESIEAQPSSPSQSRMPNSYEAPSVLAPETVEPPPPVVSKTPVAPPQLNNKNTAPTFDELLPPAKGDSSETPPALPEKPKGLSDTPQASSGMGLPKKNPNLPDLNSLTEQVTMPESIVRSAQQPKLMAAPPMPSDTFPTTGPRDNSVQPNPFPSLLQRRFPKRDDAQSQGALERKIRLPEGSKVQFASATEPIADRKPKPVTDPKMVEIAFHPTMCRGHNFDDKQGDDGLYLVVTPLNAASQILNQTGTLTIIAEDPTASKEEARVGAWEFSSEQLQELLEPVGAGQGFHLSLPWPAKPPSGKVVSVFLRFTSENGRTLVNQREIHLRIPSNEQQVWTPRKTSE